MAYLAETPEWVEGIHQIETNERVLGGADGVANAQAKGLAARTLYLKTEQESDQVAFEEHISDDNPHANSAPIENPSFTGIPLAPTAPEGTNTTQIATTGYVQNEINKLKSDTILVYEEIPTIKLGKVIDVIDIGRLQWRTLGSWTGYASLWIGKPYHDSTPVPRSMTIEAVGGTFLKSKYPALWAWAVANAKVVAAVDWKVKEEHFVDLGTMFRVPDLQDVVFRSTGIDLDNANARVLGSYQSDQLRSHHHGYGVRIHGDTGPGSSYNDVLKDGGYVEKNTLSAGGAETRPQNTALAPRIIAY